MTSNLTSIDNGTYGLFALISTIFVVIVHIGIAMMLSFPLTCVAIVSSGLLLLVLSPSIAGLMSSVRNFARPWLHYSEF